MDYQDLIYKIERHILGLQRCIDQLKKGDAQMVQNILLTRQDAADMAGISLRQLDRICHDFRIPKIHTIQGVRIRRTDILAHMGLTSTMGNLDVDD